jgi:hypothetical protein
VCLVSDGGDDLADIARRFGCAYERADRIGRPPWPAEVMREWLGRFAAAARRGRAEHVMLLEDDVLVRGEIRRSPHFAIAGPWHDGARLSPAMAGYLRRRHRHLRPTHFGGCGGTLFHREALIEAAGRFDFGTFEFLESLDRRVHNSDFFVTLVFLLAGHEYSSLEDVFCEADPRYPIWEHDGRPIVHQYKRFYGAQLTPEDVDDLDAATGAPHAEAPDAR